MREHLLGAQLLAGLQTDPGCGHLAPRRLRNAKHRAVGNLGQLENHVLDFFRINILAARDDHVFGAIDQRDEAVGIYRGQITRPAPVVAKPEKFARLRRFVEIAEHQVGPA